MKNVNLFVIRQRGRDMYWNCSSEHGTGWNEGRPKQAFSPSELTKEIRRLIDAGWWQDCEILELSVHANDSAQCAHENISFHASTGAERHTPLNVSIGLTARCRDCGRAWTGDVVTGCAGAWAGQN